MDEPPAPSSRSRRGRAALPLRFCPMDATVTVAVGYDVSKSTTPHSLSVHTPRVTRRLSRALLRQQGTPAWLAFSAPDEQFIAYRLDEVRAVLDRIDAAARSGKWVVGMITYDAAPAFDTALVARRDPAIPLVAFAAFSAPHPSKGPKDAAFDIGSWTASRTEADYLREIAFIHDAIAAGTVYQVNHTLRLTADFDGDPEGFFSTLYRAQPGDRVAFLDFGDAAACSASPELFLRRRGRQVETQPMKGTRPRHRDPRQDRELVQNLRRSAKDQAENTMIVDMARNDLGRIAEVGSVVTPHLHCVESYPTVHQMTSTVRARTSASFADLVAATFPAASITGAPKVSACRIIAELENEARGIYTGCVGVLEPGGDLTLNVAIRTAWIDRRAKTATYGIGGGIVWDSHARDEWREAHDKARILRRAAPSFRLLETLLWTPDSGAVLLERHLDRLKQSALHFNFRVDEDEVRQRFDTIDADGPRRLRLLVDPDGEIELQAHSFEVTRWATPFALPLDTAPVDSEDEFLRHKTTRRERYDAARARFPDAFDVVLWNDRHEITESTVANVVAEIDGQLVTPPVEAGLLPGALRAELIAQGFVAERSIALADVGRIRSLWLINSVRGWIPITLRPPTDRPSP